MDIKQVTRDKSLPDAVPQGRVKLKGLTPPVRDNVRLISLFLCFFVSLFDVSFVYAQTFKSGPEQTLMLELFTSEGCSSCPVADEWLSGLKTHPKLWDDFVPAAFHVTYWNYLGWKDEYSKPEFDDKQRSYVRALKGTSLATPTITVNAHPWSGWYSGRTMPKPLLKNPGILELQNLGNNKYVARYQPDKNFKGNFEVNAALLGFQISSKITAGENRGKTLDHDFVALDMTKRPLVAEGDVLEAHFALEAPQKSSAKRYGIAVWVSSHNKIMPIQAVGGYLEN